MSIKELICDLPKFMIPYDFFDLYWYIKLIQNSKYDIIIPKNVILNLNNNFNISNNKNLNIKIDEFKDYIRTHDDFKLFRSSKILYYNTEIPDNMIQCENCGNIWDGNAQCNCWGWNYILEQFNDDIDEDIPTILSIDNDGITDTESIDSDEEN